MTHDIGRAVQTETVELDQIPVVLIPDYPEDIPVSGFVSLRDIPSRTVPEVRSLVETIYADSIALCPVELVPAPAKQDVAPEVVTVVETRTVDLIDYVCFGLQALKYGLLGGVVCVTYYALDMLFAFVATNAATIISTVLTIVGIVALAGWAVFSRRSAPVAQPSLVRRVATSAVSAPQAVVSAASGESKTEPKPSRFESMFKKKSIPATKRQSRFVFMFKKDSLLDMPAPAVEPQLSARTKQWIARLNDPRSGQLRQAAARDYAISDGEDLCAVRWGFEDIGPDYERQRKSTAYTKHSLREMNDYYGKRFIRDVIKMNDKGVSLPEISAYIGAHAPRS